MQPMLSRVIRVCIESPFRPRAARGSPEFAAELERNFAYADALMLDSLRRGEAPFLSHLLYTRVLSGGDDRDPGERRLGIAAGTAWARMASKIVVGTDLGVTDGMRERILWARGRRIAVEERSLPEWSGLIT